MGPCSQDVALGTEPYRSAKTMHHKSLCKGSEPWFEFLGLFVFQKQSHWTASWKPYSSAGFLKTQPGFDQKVLKSANLLTNPTNVYTFKANPKPSACARAGILLWRFPPPVLAKTPSMPCDRAFGAGMPIFWWLNMPAGAKNKYLHPNKIFSSIFKTPNKKQFCILV